MKKILKNYGMVSVILAGVLFCSVSCSKTSSKKSLIDQYIECVNNEDAGHFKELHEKFCEAYDKGLSDSDYEKMRRAYTDEFMKKQEKLKEKTENKSSSSSSSKNKYSYSDYLDSEEYKKSMEELEKAEREYDSYINSGEYDRDMEEYDRALNAYDDYMSSNY